MSRADDDVKAEDIERRRELRTELPGMKITLAGREGAFTVLEASRRGFFVRCTHPDTFALAEIHDAEITLDDKCARCRLEVIRKEIEPRRGIALRIAYIDPRNEETLKAILGPAG